MADYSIGAPGGYGEGGQGLGTTGTSSGEGLSAPSDGYFGGSGGYSGGNGGGIAAAPSDLFSYDPYFGSGYTPTTSYSLGDLYPQDSGTGFNMVGTEGLQAPANPFGDTGRGFGGQEQDEDFWSTGWGKFVKGLGRFALATNPVGRLGLMGYDAYNAIQRGQYGQAVGSAIGAATGNGLYGSVAGIGVDAAMGKPVGERIGATAGSMIGGGIAGPVGAQVGGYVGRQAGRAGGAGATGPSNAPRGDGQDPNGFNFGNLAAGLGSLYLNNRSAREASSNVQDLGAMFGPNSAYSQQLRQQLERRDAAAGRRSQYGPREVELQARLAQMAAQYGPNIAQSNISAQQLAQQRRSQNLNTLYSLGRETGLFDQAQQYLGDMFSSNSSQEAPLYFDSNTSGDVYSV